MEQVLPKRLCTYTRIRLMPEDERSMILPNMENYSDKDTASHTMKL